MDSDSDNNSIDEQMNAASAADWGKAKYDYYYTDYVDKDYPSKLTAKEERLAAIEQEEALRIQKKLLASLDDVNYEAVLNEATLSDCEQDLINFIEVQNNSIDKLEPKSNLVKSAKRKRVAFENQEEKKTSEEGSSDDDDQDESEEEQQNSGQDELLEEENVRRRRPINMAIKKNRGLTPYKKKEYRNPRVKHKLKYKKALSKRRRNVQEKQAEFYRYSGETAGIKTSTIKSIKL